MEAKTETAEATVRNPGTTSAYRLDLLSHVDRTHGGDYWVWSLTDYDGECREGGRVDDLAGRYDLDAANATAEAERVADEVCRMLDINRAGVVLAMEGRQW